METIIKVTQLLLSLSLLVIVHEFGHFIFAKIFKCRVEKFYLFFDYKFSLFKKKIGQTEFGIGWIPFGGYVKISGMVDESMDKDQLAQPMQPWEYRAKPAWQRFFIIIGGVMMNIVLAMMIYIGMTWAWGEQYIKNADVTNGAEYSQVAQDMGFRNGDQVLTVAGDSVESFFEIPAKILFADNRTVEVLRSNGEKATITITDSMIKPMLKTPGFMTLRRPFEISVVEEGSPAEEAYLKAGDKLLAADSTPMVYFDEFRTYFQTKTTGDSINLTALRGADTVQTTVAIADGGKIGVMVAADWRGMYPIAEKQYSFLEAIPAGITKGSDKIGEYIQQLKVIFTPETQAYKEVGGFIAMGKIFPSQWSWVSFWNITALLSIMLAVLNILPIPALDGGHLVFIIYEMITRRVPSQKFMEIAQYIGFIIIIALVVAVNGNDIIKLISGQ